MPWVPTVRECGCEGFPGGLWIRVFAPAGTPQPLVDKLYGAFKESLADATVAGKLRALGLQLSAVPPDQSAKQVAADLVRWRKAIEDAKIKAE